MSTSTERVALALVVVLAAQSALAASPSATDLATARELYKSGVGALDAGDAQGAAPKLSSAWQLAPTPLIGVALARAQAKLGHLVEARESVLAVRRLEIVANETVHSKQARVDAETIEADMARRIAKLHLEVKDAPEGSSVIIDGVSVALASFAVDRPMNPGAHEIELGWGPAPRVHTSITVAEAERKIVVLDSPPAEAAKIDTPTVFVETKPPIAPLAPIEPAPRTRLSPLVPIGGTIAGVGAAAGAIFGALALGDSSSIKGACDPVTHACGPGAQGTLHEAQAFATTSTIAFAVAGTGLVLLVIGLAVGHHDDKVRTTAQRLIVTF